MTDWTPDRVRALRARLGYTQHQLADRIGCHRQAIANWETGQRTPTGLYAQSLQSLEDAPMTALITLIDADQLHNTVLSDLAFASIGDPDAREQIRPDHLGTTMLTARVEHPTRTDAEIVVIWFPGAGNQLFIAADGGSPDAIELGSNAERNDDPALRSSLQTAIDLWYDDPDGLGGSLLASPADPYR